MLQFSELYNLTRIEINNTYNIYEINMIRPCSFRGCQWYRPNIKLLHNQHWWLIFQLVQGLRAAFRTCRTKFKK